MDLEAPEGYFAWVHGLSPKGDRERVVDVFAGFTEPNACGNPGCAGGSVTCTGVLNNTLHFLNETKGLHGQG